GSVYGRVGKLSEAERALHTAIQFDPTLSKAHLELVNLYLREKRTPEAIAELKFFLKTFPSDPMAPQVRQVLSRLEGPTPQASKSQ
ncbi:MAG: tetratricopeptide repeat protein, partial [Terriglobales bacterium]